MLHREVCSALFCGRAEVLAVLSDKRCTQVAARPKRLLRAQVLPVKGVGLFSTSEDGSVRVSDLDRRRLVHECRLHTGPVHAVIA